MNGCIKLKHRQKEYKSEVKSTFFLPNELDGCVFFDVRLNREPIVPQQRGKFFPDSLFQIATYEELHEMKQFSERYCLQIVKLLHEEVHPGQWFDRAKQNGLHDDVLGVNLPGSVELFGLPFRYL